MILPDPKDALHKAWMYRVLIHVLDDPVIAGNIYFKGGTCASMLGFLDRFSVDLDFDLGKDADKKNLRKALHTLFKLLKLQITYENPRALQFVLKYEAASGQRNTLHIDMIDSVISGNVYAAQFLKEIDRYAICQTKETMFAHKLVAVIDRFRRYLSIAGRDIYDIHHFFTAGFRFVPAVIEERTGKKIPEYLAHLRTFISENVTQTVIDEDLNTLLPRDKYAMIRKTLKTEVLAFLT